MRQRRDRLGRRGRPQHGLRPRCPAGFHDREHDQRRDEERRREEKRSVAWRKASIAFKLAGASAKPLTGPHEVFPASCRGEAQRDLRRKRAREANLGVSRGAQIVIALLGAVVGRGRDGGTLSAPARRRRPCSACISAVAGHRRRSRDVGQRIDRRRRRAERDSHRQTIFRRRRLAGAVEVGGEIVGQIMADAVLDRRDFDRAQILDQTGMRGLAVKGLEATRKSGRRARAPRGRRNL